MGTKVSTLRRNLASRSDAFTSAASTLVPGLRLGVVQHAIAAKIGNVLLFKQNVPGGIHRWSQVVHGGYIMTRRRRGNAHEITSGWECYDQC